jgi:hypothetical protein
MNSIRDRLLSKEKLMSNYLIALAIAGAMSVSAAPQRSQPVQPGQPVQSAPTNQAQPAAPQMVKKTVCEDNDNPYSHISRICHTMMVPAQPAQAPRNQQAQTPQQPNLGN